MFKKEASIHAFCCKKKKFTLTMLSTGVLDPLLFKLARTFFRYRL